MADLTCDKRTLQKRIWSDHPEWKDIAISPQQITEWIWEGYCFRCKYRLEVFPEDKPLVKESDRIDSCFG